MFRSWQEVDDESSGSSEEEEAGSSAGASAEADSDSSSGPEETPEAAEAAAFQGFRDALGLMGDEDWAGAVDRLLLVHSAPVLHSTTHASPALRKLRYAIWKNLGQAFRQLDKWEEAAASWGRAVELGGEDGLVWLWLGQASVRAARFGPADDAFRQGLRLAAQGPDQRWPFLEGLIATSYALQDTHAVCLFADQALADDPTRQRAAAARIVALEKSPYLAPVLPAFSHPRPPDDVLGKVKENLERLSEAFLKDYLKPGPDEGPPAPLPVLASSLPSKTWSGLLVAFAAEAERLKSTGEDLRVRWDFAAWLQEEEKDEPMEVIEVPSSSAQEKEEEERRSGVEETLKSLVERVCGVGEEVELSLHLSADSDPSRSSGHTSDAQPHKRRKKSARNRMLERLESRRFPAPREAGDSADDEVFKRRSARNLPGFSLQDDYLCVPKPRSVAEKLRPFLPKRLLQRRPQDTASSEGRDGGEEKAEEEASVAFLPTEAGKVTEFLEAWSDAPASRVLEALLKETVALSGERRLGRAAVEALVGLGDEWFFYAQRKLPDQEGWTEWETRLCLLHAEARPRPPNPHFTSRGQVQIMVREFREELGEDLWLQMAVRDAWLTFRLGGERPEDLEKCRELLEDQPEGTRVLLPSDPEEAQLSLATLDAKIESFRQLQLLQDAKSIYDAGDYERVVEIVSEALGRKGPGFEKESRLEQLELLVESLLRTGRTREVVLWLREGLKETLRKTKEAASTAEKMASLTRLESMVERLGRALTADPKAVAAEADADLAHPLVELIQLRQDHKPADDAVLVEPWLALYRLSKAVEAPTEDGEELARWWGEAGGSRVVLGTRSLMVLSAGHAELGSQGRCCVAGGRLVRLLAEELMETLKLFPQLPSPVHDQMLNAAEQAFFCLYQYPAKKRRHLEEHGAGPGLELGWAELPLLFAFVRPEAPPEFDAVRSDTVSADAVQLLLRIQGLVPEMLRPDPLLPHFEAHLLGEEDEPPLKPPLGNEEGDEIIAELHHLLGDNFLKSQDFPTAAHHYSLDLIVQPGRFDSWAGLAQAWMGLVQNELNDLAMDTSLECRTRVDRHSRLALAAFERALALRPGYTIVQLELACLSYQLAAYSSRLHKQLTRTGPDKQLDSPRKRHTQLLKKVKADSKRHLDKADAIYAAMEAAEEEAEDPWLRAYFRGKVAEKRQRPLGEVLTWYRRSLWYQMRDGAIFPAKVRYQGGKRLAMESLELHYRAHAAVLKALERRELSLGELREVHWQLGLFRASPLSRNDYADEELVQRRRAEWDADPALHRRPDDPPSKDGLEGLVDELAEATSLREEVLGWCLDAMRLVIRRFYNHYKAYRRLGSALLRVRPLRDARAARRVLLGPPPPGLAQSLFQARKSNNLFEGVYRIPLDDVDRNGSFEAHVEGTVGLVLEVLVAEGGHSDSLLQLHSQLLKMRTLDKGKQFLRHDHREELRRRTVQALLRLFRGRVEAAGGERSAFTAIVGEMWRARRQLLALDPKITAPRAWAALMLKLHGELTQTPLTVEPGSEWAAVERLSNFFIAQSLSAQHLTPQSKGALSTSLQGLSPRRKRPSAFPDPVGQAKRQVLGPSSSQSDAFEIDLTEGDDPVPAPAPPPALDLSAAAPSSVATSSGASSQGPRAPPAPVFHPPRREAERPGGGEKKKALLPKASPTDLVFQARLGKASVRPEAATKSATLAALFQPRAAAGAGASGSQGPRGAGTPASHASAKGSGSTSLKPGSQQIRPAPAQSAVPQLDMNAMLSSLSAGRSPVFAQDHSRIRDILYSGGAAASSGRAVGRGQGVPSQPPIQALSPQAFIQANHQFLIQQIQQQHQQRNLQQPPPPKK